MTIEIKDVVHLANLARVAISDSEKEELRRDLDEILAYVSQVKEVGQGKQLTIDTASRTFDGVQGGRWELRNIMRDDRDPHPPGLFTETLLSAAPAREDDRLLVKKILGDN